MKKSVSSSLNGIRYFIILFLIGFVIINIVNFVNEVENHDYLSFIISLSFLIVFSLILYLVFKYLGTFKTIEYDSNFVYISDKSETKTILLGDVVSLKMSKLKINNNNGWKLTYKDEDNTDMIVKFFPRHLHVNLAEFGDEILKNNPNAKIQEFKFGPFLFHKNVD